jgi:hypothetical protein
MGKRIVFEFLKPPDRPPTAWNRVQRFLRAHGASDITTPTGNPPYTLTAVLPDTAEVDQVLRDLRALDGVGQADEDVWRDAYMIE